MTGVADTDAVVVTEAEELSVVDAVPDAQKVRTGLSEKSGEYDSSGDSDACIVNDGDALGDDDIEDEPDAEGDICGETDALDDTLGLEVTDSVVMVEAEMELEKRGVAVISAVLVTVAVTEGVDDLVQVADTVEDWHPEDVADTE